MGAFFEKLGDKIRSKDYQIIMNQQELGSGE